LAESSVAEAVLLEEKHAEIKKPKQQEESDDGSSDDEGVAASAPPQNVPPPPPGAAHPSIGSERHALGACRRCCFFPRGRCINGYDCEFCHYEHDKRKRKNKTKKRAEAAVMRLAPRAMHAPLAFGAPVPSRSWMFPPPPPQQQMGFPCATMVPSAGSMIGPSLVGHRPEGTFTYATPVLMPVQQPCVQQFLVYGTGPEHSVASGALAGLPSQAMPPQQYGRQVIHLPPAVSEQASIDGMLPAPFSSAAPELDFELAPPPPPVCSPNLPHSCASSQQHPTLPPPSAPPRLVVSESGI